MTFKFYLTFILFHFSFNLPFDFHSTDIRLHLNDLHSIFMRLAIYLPFEFNLTDIWLPYSFLLFDRDSTTIQLHNYFHSKWIWLTFESHLTSILLTYDSEKICFRFSFDFQSTFIRLTFDFHSTQKWLAKIDCLTTSIQLTFDLPLDCYFPDCYMISKRFPFDMNLNDI